MLELLSSEWNFFYFTLTIVIVAGKLRDIYVKSIPGRNERLRKEQERQHTLELLHINSFMQNTRKYWAPQQGKGISRS